MERKLQERMIGAGVLVLALVLVAPLLLDGTPRGTVDEADIPGQRGDELRSHTFRLDQPGGPAQSAPPAPPPPVVPAPAPREPGVAASSAGPDPPAASPSPAEPTPGPPPATVANAPRAAVPPAAGAPPPRAATGTAPESATAPAQAAPASNQGGWVVQVGTFGQKDNAERLVATLGGKGFAAFLSPTTRSGKTLYRVRVGPPAAKPEAQAMAGRLAAAGQAGQVVAN
jgi:DedD protein